MNTSGTQGGILGAKWSNEHARGKYWERMWSPSIIYILGKSSLFPLGTDKIFLKFLIFPLYKGGKWKIHLSNNSLQPELSNMNITTILKQFFLPLITKLLQLFPKFNPQHQQPSSSGDAVDPELPDLAAGDDGVDPVEVPPDAAGLVVVHLHIHNMDWADLMIGFCFSVALELASLSAQSNTQLSATFHLLSLAILFAFAFFFVSQFIKPKFLVTAQKLKNFGVFFSVTAFFMAITIPFPLYLKLATAAIYTISVFAIIIFHCL